MNSDRLIKLLEKRHADDVFVAECKSGPSQGHKHLRLDGWALKKSWANPCAIGYEIKVSRSDFLRDNKWHAYLALCNQFYFVAPAGIIDPKEVPEKAGLLLSSTNGAILYQKKKAPYREVEIPESLFRYVLYSRVRVTREYQDTVSKRAFWEEWLREKKLDQQFGWRVGEAIQARIKDEIRSVQHQNEKLQAEAAKYDSFKRTLLKHGLDPDESEWRFDHKVKEFLSGVPDRIEDDLRVFGAAVKTMEKNLARMRGKPVAEEAEFVHQPRF